jgi:hypothetical protein
MIVVVIKIVKIITTIIMTIYNGTVIIISPQSDSRSG